MKIHGVEGGILWYLGEHFPVPFLVDHLHHPDDRPPDANGHAQDGLGDIPSLKKLSE